MSNYLVTSGNTEVQKLSEELGRICDEKYHTCTDFRPVILSGPEESHTVAGALQQAKDGILIVLDNSMLKTFEHKKSRKLIAKLTELFVGKRVVFATYEVSEKDVQDFFDDTGIGDSQRPTKLEPGSLPKLASQICTVRKQATESSETLSFMMPNHHTPASKSNSLEVTAQNLNSSRWTPLDPSSIHKTDGLKSPSVPEIPAVAVESHNSFGLSSSSNSSFSSLSVSPNKTSSSPSDSSHGSSDKEFFHKDTNAAGQRSPIKVWKDVSQHVPQDHTPYFQTLEVPRSNLVDIPIQTYPNQSPVSHFNLASTHQPTTDWNSHQNQSQQTSFGGNPVNVDTCGREEQKYSHGQPACQLSANFTERLPQHLQSLSINENQSYAHHPCKTFVSNHQFPASTLSPQGGNSPILNHQSPTGYQSPSNTQTGNRFVPVQQFPTRYQSPPVVNAEHIYHSSFHQPSNSACVERNVPGPMLCRENLQGQSLENSLQLYSMLTSYQRVCLSNGRCQRCNQVKDNILFFQSRPVVKDNISPTSPQICLSVPYSNGPEAMAFSYSLCEDCEYFLHSVQYQACPSLASVNISQPEHIQYHRIPSYQTFTQSRNDTLDFSVMETNPHLVPQNSVFHTQPDMEPRGFRGNLPNFNSAPARLGHLGQPVPKNHVNQPLRPEILNMDAQMRQGQQFIKNISTEAPQSIIDNTRIRSNGSSSSAKSVVTESVFETKQTPINPQVQPCRFLQPQWSVPQHQEAGPSSGGSPVKPSFDPVGASSASNGYDHLPLVNLSHVVIEYIQHQMDFATSSLNWERLAHLHGWNFGMIQTNKQKWQKKVIESPFLELIQNSKDFQNYTYGQLKDDLEKIPRKDILERLREFEDKEELIVKFT